MKSKSSEMSWGGGSGCRKVFWRGVVVSGGVIAVLVTVIVLIAR